MVLTEGVFVASGATTLINKKKSDGLTRNWKSFMLFPASVWKVFHGT